MEMNTIIGIVIAVVIMLVGLIMILRKPKPVELSLEADLHVNPESQQPVIPRHVRDQLLQSNSRYFTANRIKSGENYCFRCIIYDQVYTCHGLKGTDVTSLTSDDSSLHLITWKLHN